MLPEVPFFISAIYIMMTLLFLYFFWRMLQKDLGNKVANQIIAALLVWSTFVCVLAANGVYQDFTVKPPPFVFAVLPILLVIIFVLFKYTAEVKKLSILRLTYLHIVRVPVEIFIFIWFTYKLVPQEMTFEGRNFDILAGLTAPIIAYFISKNGIKKHAKMAYIWNIFSLLLVTNIVIIAMLSTASDFQVFGLNQPNIAVINFPFILLPSVIVPIVIFCQIVGIIKLREI